MNTHDAWEQIHQNREWGQYPSEHIIRFIARNFYSAEREKVKILDFGCGGGSHTWYLARENFDTYAFDISETAVEKVKERLHREHIKADIRVMDGTKLTYDNNFFDAVIDNVSILTNRLLDIKMMYTNVYNVLKVGGKFITVVFGRKTTGYGTGRELEPGTFEGITEGNLQRVGCRHFFEEEELKEILVNIGFKNVEIEYIISSDRGNIMEQYIAMGVK